MDCMLQCASSNRVRRSRKLQGQIQMVYFQPLHFKLDYKLQHCKMSSARFLILPGGKKATQQNLFYIPHVCQNRDETNSTGKMDNRNATAKPSVRLPPLNWSDPVSECQQSQQQRVKKRREKHNIPGKELIWKKNNRF